MIIDEAIRYRVTRFDEKGIRQETPVFERDQLGDALVEGMTAWDESDPAALCVQYLLEEGGTWLRLKTTDMHLMEYSQWIAHSVNMTSSFETTPRDLLEAQAILMFVSGGLEGLWHNENLKCNDFFAPLNIPVARTG